MTARSSPLLATAMAAASLSLFATPSYAARRCSYPNGARFPAVYQLRASHTSCSTARWLARGVQSFYASYHRFMRFKSDTRHGSWTAHYVRHQGSDNPYYKAVWRHGHAAVTADLAS
jgi:hypothetical protein